MIKKGLIAAGALVTAFAATVGLVIAQTATPVPTDTPIPTVAPSPTATPTVSPSPTASPRVPQGAPATGRG